MIALQVSIGVAQRPRRRAARRRPEAAASRSRPGWSRRRAAPGRGGRGGRARARPGGPVGPRDRRAGRRRPRRSATATTCVAKGTAWSWLPFAVGIPLLPVYGWLGAAGALPAFVRDPASRSPCWPGRPWPSPTPGPTSSATRRPASTRSRRRLGPERAWRVHAGLLLGGRRWLALVTRWSRRAPGAARDRRGRRRAASVVACRRRHRAGDGRAGRAGSGRGSSRRSASRVLAVAWLAGRHRVGGLAAGAG